MVNQYRIACLLIFSIVSVILLISASSDPNDGKTGAPGDGLCSECHSGNSFEGTVALEGLEGDIISGQQYNLKVVVHNTDGNAARAGFQIVSLFEDGFINAGEFQTVDERVGVSTSNERIYAEHRNALSFEENLAEWEFNWVAPEVDEIKEVAIYLAGNITDGNGRHCHATIFTRYYFAKTI